MSYTILWMPRAVNALGDIWLASSDRNAVTAASNRIDLQLAADPHDVGESREEDRRLVIDSPLQVLFRIRVEDRIVEVLSVGTFGR